MLLISFISTIYAAEPDLGKQLQNWSAQHGEKILVGTSGLEAHKTAKSAHQTDPQMSIYIKELPPYSNVKVEMNKAMVWLGARCGLHIRMVGSTPKITPYGACVTKDRTVSVHETETDWFVVDQEKRTVRALDYAILNKDISFEDFLRKEQQQAARFKKTLTMSSYAIAGAALVPLTGMEPGFPPSSENRLWTSAFLLSSAGLMYYAAKIPVKANASKQQTIKNYLPYEVVKAQLEQNWPTPEELPAKENPSEKTMEEVAAPPDSSPEEAPVKDTSSEEQPSAKPVPSENLPTEESSTKDVTQPKTPAQPEETKTQPAEDSSSREQPIKSDESPKTEGGEE